MAKPSFGNVGFSSFSLPQTERKEKKYMVDIVDTDAGMTLHSFFMYSVDEAVVLKEVKKFLRDGIKVKIYQPQWVEINE